MPQHKITISMPSLGLLALVGVLLAGDMAVRYVRADPPADAARAAKTLSAQEFRLTDAQGNTRAVLGVRPMAAPPSRFWTSRASAAPP